MEDNILRKEEFYRELRALEQRAQEKLYDSHMALSDSISNNVNAIKKSVEKVATTLETHIIKEEEHQNKMEKMLASVDMEDLRSSLQLYRNAVGFKVFISALSKLIGVLGIVGGALVWIVHKLDL